MTTFSVNRDLTGTITLHEPFFSSEIRALYGSVAFYGSAPRAEASLQCFLHVHRRR